MDRDRFEIREMHWLMDMLQTIDVGLIVIDRDARIQVWNSFMENHSGKPPHEMIGHNLFERCGDIDQAWFSRKIESVVLLKNRAFTTWEQRPYLIRFRNYRPITGTAEFMYQNVTLIPLMSADNTVSHVGIIIYDVTDMATGKQQLQKANSELQALSRTDGLTGLNNRAYWEEQLACEFLRTRRSGKPSCLVMFDIDHFKKVNDTYGHPAGDEVIRATAAALTRCKRATDIAGRYGGEEFGVILVDTDANNARVFAERLRRAIEQEVVVHQGRRITWTISLGIAGTDDSLSGHQPWLERSDQALYQAKEGGRNRSVVYAVEAEGSDASAKDSVV